MESVEARPNTTFGSLVLILSDIALLEAIYMLLNANNANVMHNVSFWTWSSITVLVFALYYLFLRKERTATHAIIFLGVSYLITVTILLLVFLSSAGWLFTIFAILFCAIPLFRIYFLFEEPPKIDRLIARFSALIFMLLLVLLFIIGTGNSFIHALSCAGALVLCLIAIIVLRTRHGGADGSRRIRGIGVIFGFLLLIGVTVAVFVMVSFGDVLAAGAVALWAGLTYLGGIIARFFTWLFSLFQVREFDAAPGELTPMPSGEAAMMGEMMDFSEAILAVFLIAVGISALSIVIFFAIKLRKNKLGGRGVKRTVVTQRTRMSLQAIAEHFIKNFQFFINGIIYRNTPQGVFLKLERWGKLRRKGRAASETPRSYLERISDSVPEQKEALSKLADALDISWYGEKTEAHIETSVIKSIRKAFI